MPARNIVMGQRVDPVKSERARELRKRMTPEEKLLWEHLRAKRLGGWHFRRQQVIQGFIVDFYCHAAGLVVELDGEIHRNQAVYDTERDSVLSTLGLSVLHISNGELHQDLDGVRAKILEACEIKR
jgi:very-short-patch-repair endonuclease